MLLFYNQSVDAVCCNVCFTVWSIVPNIVTSKWRTLFGNQRLFFAHIPLEFKKTCPVLASSFRTNE